MDAFNHYLSQPLGDLSEVDLKSLQFTPGEDGQFVIAPREFADEVVRLLDNMLYIRRFASFSKFSGSQSPATHAESSTVERGLHVRNLSGKAKITKKLFERAKTAPYALVAERLGYWLGLAEEKEFLVGSGSDQCLGLFTPSAQGISTRRDFPSTSSSSLSADDFIGALMMLDAEYQARARWILHPDILMLAMKLQDQRGRPLYDEDPTNSPSPTIAGAPFIMSSYAPNKVATGQYVAVIGDLSWYAIAEAMEFGVRATVEHHPANNKNSYVVRTLVDGMPLLEEAFVRLKMAISPQIS